MYDHQKSGSHHSAAAHDASERHAGKTTLTQQLAVDDPTSPPMFEAEPQWEDIDPAEALVPPLPSGVVAAKSAAGPRAAEPQVPQAPTPDAHEVTADTEAPAPSEPTSAAPDDPLHVGQHSNPHDGPFERKLTHSDRHRPHVDGFNRGTVHSDHATAHVFGRPGVVSHGHGVFQLKEDTTRYLYTAQGDVNVAIPFDTIHKDKLLSINNRAHLNKKDAATYKKEHDAGRTMRLALNPSMARQLSIDGKNTWCVLSWIDGNGGGAAWLPLDALKGDAKRHTQIHQDVNRLARHENPSLALLPSTPYIIRDDAVGHADDIDKGTPKDKDKDKKKPHGRVLAPGAHSGDNVSHYLVHEPRFKKVKQGFVAICMNLPEGSTPPVAVDTGLAGDTFFVFNDRKFHREVAVYDNGAPRSHRRQMWVFGHLGMKKGGSGPDAATMVPDPNRAGWVPLRVLKPSTP